MNYHLTKKSGNGKTGPMPTSTVSRDTCPPDCPLFEGECYGEKFHQRMHWDKVSSGERGMSLTAFCEEVRKIPEGKLWRHCVTGDQPGLAYDIDPVQMDQLVDANKGRRGYSYTHKTVLASTKKAMINRKALRDANLNGYTVNLSANSLDEADAKSALNIGPVAVVMPKEWTGKATTKEGRKVVQCPATICKGNKRKPCKGCGYCDLTCDSCGLCQVTGYKETTDMFSRVIVGFPKH